MLASKVNDLTQPRLQVARAFSWRTRRRVMNSSIFPLTIPLHLCHLGHMSSAWGGEVH